MLKNTVMSQFRVVALSSSGLHNSVHLLRNFQYHFYHQPSQFGHVVFSQVSFGTKNTNAMRTNANK